MSQAPPPNTPYQNPGAPAAGAPGGDSGNAQILSIVALVLAGISLPCNCCCWPVSLMLAIGSVVCAVLAWRESRDALPTVALVFSIIAAVLAVIMSIFSIIMMATGQNEQFMKDFEQMLKDIQQQQQPQQAPANPATPGGASLLEEPSIAPTRAYYYDLRTGDLFTGPIDAVPPIEAPSGPARGPGTSEAGPRAHVFSCSSCDDESSHFIGYMEMYKPEAKQYVLSETNTEPDPQEDQLLREGHVVTTLEASEWVALGSEEGVAIIRAAQRHCGEGQKPKPCFPE